MAEGASPKDQAGILDFLSSGRAFGGSASPERIETNGAFVFLTSDRAWKLKKAKRLPWLDLRTREARERWCREELRLNRELAGPEVYLGVTPVTQEQDGTLALGGRGHAVDWLIEMRRLPAAQMLENRLADGPPVRPDEIDALCDTMIAFYRAHPAPEGAGDVYAARLRHESRLNARNLREMRQWLGAPLPESLLDEALAEIEARRPEILGRASHGLLVDGHGDLRPEHVCLLASPVVFDRVEFDPDLRRLDPYDEMGALGLECARGGAGWIREQLLDRLQAAGIAPPGPALQRAYALYRCLTRARLALDHLRVPNPRTPAKWPAVARACLAQAERLGRS